MLAQGVQRAADTSRTSSAKVEWASCSLAAPPGSTRVEGHHTVLYVVPHAACLLFAAQACHGSKHAQAYR
jgi:hypothetical protein